jgi:hypothetical protein
MKDFEPTNPKQNEDESARDRLRRCRDSNTESSWQRRDASTTPLRTRLDPDCWLGVCFTRAWAGKRRAWDLGPSCAMR